MYPFAKNFRPDIATYQKGATLAVALIFLVLITLITVTALSTTTLEEKMAGNFKDLELASQAAQAALRDAKLDINGVLYPGAAPTTTAPRTPAISGGTGFGASGGGFGTVATGTCSTAGLCLPMGLLYTDTPNNASWVLSQNFTAAPSVQYGTYTLFPAFPGVARQPRYLIEAVTLKGSGTGSSPFWVYRITAVGYGANVNTQVIAQEVFLPHS